MSGTLTNVVDKLRDLPHKVTEKLHEVVGEHAVHGETKEDAKEAFSGNGPTREEREKYDEAKKTMQEEEAFETAAAANLY